MRLRALLCLAVSLTVAEFRAGAQAVSSPAPPPTPPSLPFLETPPDPSAWTIVRHTLPGLGSVSADAAIRAAAITSQPDSVTLVTRVGSVRHRSRKLKSGEQEDIWYEYGSRITMESMWKIPMFEGSTSPATQPLGPDFPELTWMSAGNFVGTQNYQNVAYFVFEAQVAEGSASKAKEYGSQLKSALKRVYINPDTRLPLLLQTGDVVQRYTFQATPAGPINVPPEYQVMFDTYEKNVSEAASRPMVPN